MVESALRSRRLTSKELGHVIMCAYGAPRAGIFNERELRDIPSRGQFLTFCVPAGHSLCGRRSETGPDKPCRPATIGDMSSEIEYDDGRAVLDGNGVTLRRYYFPTGPVSYTHLTLPTNREV